MLLLSHQAAVATSPKWVVPVGGFCVAGECPLPPIRVGAGQRGEGWTVRAVAVTILLSLRWRARDARDCHHRTRFFGHQRFTDAPHCDGSHGLGGQELRFRTHKYTERALVS